MKLYILFQRGNIRNEYRIFSYFQPSALEAADNGRRKTHDQLLVGGGQVEEVHSRDPAPINHDQLQMGHELRRRRKTGQFVEERRQFLPELRSK